MAPLSNDAFAEAGYLLDVTLRMLLRTVKPPTVDVTHRGRAGGGGSEAQTCGWSSAGIAKRTW